MEHFLTMEMQTKFDKRFLRKSLREFCGSRLAIVLHGHARFAASVVPLMINKQYVMPD